MGDVVTIVGLDFGTTTSCAAIASAEVSCNSATGRMELGGVAPRGDPEQVFTPFNGERLDEFRLAEYLDGWLKDVDPSQVFGGGAMITGLAAQATNAAGFTRQTRRYLKDAVIAVGADPCLESWLAFMGNSLELSHANPDTVFVNVDIGGGTANITLGRNGEILRTGSYFVGARHIQVEPGSYRITRLSSYACRLLEDLRIRKSMGEHLTETEVGAITDWYLTLLESVLSGRKDIGPGRSHQQVAFELPADLADYAITLSGGVGQLVYAAVQGKPWPATTAFGDLGIDLAQRLLERPFWRQRMREFVPMGLGRATVYGLLRYNTQVSGSTLFVSDAGVLPLSDLVVLGSVSPTTPQADVDRQVSLAGRTAAGACLRIEPMPHQVEAIREVAQKLRAALAGQAAAQDIPLVLLMRENLGKVLGQYVTDWGASRAKVVVIDEIDPRDAQFAHIGRLREGVLPVSFHGMSAPGGVS
jgi:ethanolamine utilization protein EutA